MREKFTDSLYVIGCGFFISLLIAAILMIVFNVFPKL